MKKRILYIGWIGSHNHGDDTCYEIFKFRLTNAAHRQGIELLFSALYPANFSEFTLARINPDLVVLGAGSLFEPVYLKPLILAQQQSIPTAIWGSGYDNAVEDPFESDQIAPDSAYMIRHLVNRTDVIGVRGPLTLKMLTTIGAIHPGLHVCGDPGLLLQRELANGVAKENNLDKPHIAVNWGTARNNVFGENEKATAHSLAEAIKTLSDKYYITIFPVWQGDLKACKSLAELVDCPQAVKLMTEVPSIPELIALYEKSIITINMKLHASVFSAALKRPFVCLAYRTKCYDFAKSLDFTETTLGFAEPDLPFKIISSVESLTTNLQHYTNHLSVQKDKYEEKITILENKMIDLLN